jgi:hypothetical protein
VSQVAMTNSLGWQERSERNVTNRMKADWVDWHVWGPTEPLLIGCGALQETRQANRCGLAKKVA